MKQIEIKGNLLRLNLFCFELKHNQMILAVGYIKHLHTRMNYNQLKNRRYEENTYK